jgi:hypothetical protein
MVNPFARYAMNKTNSESQWINDPRDLSTYLGTVSPMIQTTVQLLTWRPTR